MSGKGYREDWDMQTHNHVSVSLCFQHPAFIINWAELSLILADVQFQATK